MSLATPSTIMAQRTVSADTIGVFIYYERGYSTLDTSYRGNGERLDSFIRNVENIRKDSSSVLRSMRIVGSASPDGSSEMNGILALRRATNIREYLYKRLSLADSLIHVDSRGIDWEGLAEAVEASDKPYRDEVSRILRETPEWIYKNGKIVDGRKRRLMMLDGGRVWWDMYEHFFPSLRSSDICVICDIEHYSVETTVVEVRDTDRIDTLDTVVADRCSDDRNADEVVCGISDSIPESVIEPAAAPLRVPVAALRTNLLLPLLNFGLEVPIGNRWSVEADYYYPWSWRKSDHKNCFELLFWNVGGRYWFGKRHTPGEDNYRYRLTGHSVGVYVAGGYYDIERNYSGHQGTFYSVGADYLYAIPIAKGKLHLEFSLGIGYIYSDAQAYRVREEGGRLLRKQDIKNRIGYFGPTKATVSLVVPIGKAINKQSK